MSEAIDYQKLTIKQVALDFPGNLKTAKEISEKVMVDEKKLIDFADAGYCPHWRIDGGEPMFQINETKKWVAQYLLTRCNGKALPIELKLIADPPIANDAPEQIKYIPNLRYLPRHSSPPGVYFLVKADQVVYIGQSTSIESRCIAHSRQGKEFDHIYILPTPEHLLDEVEAALIRYVKPTMNGTSKGGVYMTANAPGSDDEVLKRIGII